MKKKENWRQLRDGFLWRFFVRYHKKKDEAIPDSLTLCYYVQRLFRAVCRWFFWERLILIFSPFFFLSLVPWLIFAFVGFTSIVGEIGFLAGFTFGIVWLVVDLSYWVGKLPDAESPKWLRIVVVIFALVVILFFISVIIYRICTSPGEKVVEGFLTFGILIGACILLILLIAGIELLCDKIRGSHNWRLFVEWRKAVKKKVCPIIYPPKKSKS